MGSRSSLHKGELIAAVLAGSWRSSNYPPLEISESDLDEITPLLCKSGTAALAWRRIQVTSLASSAPADVLRQTYRHQSLQSEIHATKVEKVFTLLRQAQVEPILVKGWAASTLYDQNDLRPSGDIDLLVRPDQFKLSNDLLGAPEAEGCTVDLHKTFHEIPERGFDELIARSKLLPLGNQQVRILGPEDHLALLCVHLLKHGAWRSLWLCDVAAAVESLDHDFNWDTCFGPSNTRRGWILAAISLAGILLKADVSKCPAAGQTVPPAWLMRSVLGQWSNPRLIDRAPLNHPVPMATLLRQPSGLLEGLRQRWPNPILATISVNGEINNLPRLPYQVANWMFRLKHLVAPSE
jgi:hypothetical protein